MHIPVLLKEAIESLALKPGMKVLDATAGGGGHSKMILERITPGGKLIAVDRDRDAVERIKADMSAYGNALIPVNANFAELDDIFMDLGINKVNGALFDLGVSSFQIDTAERGFSFTADGPLDMRLDRTQQLDAYYAVNKLSRDQLAEVIKEYGEERYAKTVAAAIVKARKEKSITTTLRLAEIIKRAIGNKYFKQRLHPAARTFQGIRIYVNNELNSLKTALNGIIRHLEPKARLCVISFHSLEDRIVKNIFRDKSREKEIIIHTKKPLTPEREEIKNNYRARSAKMRVSEKT